MSVKLATTLSAVISNFAQMANRHFILILILLLPMRLVCQWVSQWVSELLPTCRCGTAVGRSAGHLNPRGSGYNSRVTEPRPRSGCQGRGCSRREASTSCWQPLPRWYIQLVQESRTATGCVHPWLFFYKTKALPIHFEIKSQIF